MTDNVPDELRVACERLDLPLFAVPPEVPLVGFTERGRAGRCRDRPYDVSAAG